MLVGTLIGVGFWLLHTIIVYAIGDHDKSFFDELILHVSVDHLVLRLIVLFGLIVFSMHEAVRIHKNAQVTQELERSEKKLRTSFEKTGEAIIETSADGIIVSANPAAARYLGYEPGLLAGKPISDMYFDHEQRDKVLRKLSENGSIDNIEITLKHKTGKQVKGLGSIVMTRNDSDGSLGTMGFFTDITEKKYIAKKVDQLTLAMEQTSDGIAIIDHDRTITYANKAFTIMHGYDPSELLGMQLKSLFFESHMDQYKADRKRLFEGGSVIDEVIHRRKDGLPVPILWSINAIKNDDGQTIGVVAVAKDITEHKQMEEMLKKQAHDLGKRLKELDCLFSITAPVEWEMSLDDRLQWVVEHIPPAWQYPEIACARITIDGDQFVSDGFRESDWVISGEVVSFDGEVQGRVEVFYLQERPQADQGPFVEEERKLIESIADVVSRLIEHKNMEKQVKEYSLNLETMVDERTKELQDAQDKLVRSEKLAAIGRLSSGIAHDLRGPLSVINNIAYYLKIKLSDSDEKIKQYLDMLEKEVSISKNIIDDLLDFVRVRKPELSETTVETMLAQALYRTNISPNIEVASNLPNDLPVLSVDADQLVRVFINIIDNAVTAMPNGGNLDISSAQR
ncbi:MAG: PAS domain S-box protein [Chloroflexi bacterium]|nr:PAS domain S-box protein [Chloroflexota bacterium]MBT7082146.1 PAS domain S-box protein [Chloroflexota bacterium]MBT7290787.1 PAS domain S-box protein [Chloroflexota bacterium]